jgi:ABC-type multidrug transport system fused ATPase/permease subunit
MNAKQGLEKAASRSLLLNVKLIAGLFASLFRRGPFRTSRFILGCIVVGFTEIVSIGMILPIVNDVIGEEAEDSFFSELSRGILSWFGLEPSIGSNLCLFLTVSFLSACIYLAVSHDRARYIFVHEVELKEGLFSKILGSTWLSWSKMSHGDVINGLTRESDNTKLAFNHLLQFISQLILILAFVGMLFYIDIELTFVAMITSSLTFLVIGPILNYSKNIGARVTLGAAHYSQIVINFCRGYKNVKVLSLAELLRGRVSVAIGRVAGDTLISNGFLVPFRVKFFEFLGMISLCVLVYASMEVTKTPHSKMLHMIVVLLKLIPMISQALNHLAQIFGYIPAFHFIEEIERGAEVEEIHKGETISQIQDISFREVDFSYPGGKRVMGNFSHRFERGRFYAICGESGAGKTTLLDLIMGLMPIEEGRLEYNKVDAEKINIDSVRNRIGYLSQNSYIFEGSIRENIVWGMSDWTEESLTRAVGVSQLSSLVEENGLDFRILESGQNLSGGQMQRLALARLLMRNYDFILLDEPTASLDLETEASILNSLVDLKGRVGVLAITHREEFLRHADEVVTIESGNG